MCCSLLSLSSKYYNLPESQQSLLYHEYYQFVYPYIYQSLRDHAATEDVIHEAPLRTIDRMPDFPEEARVRAWIRTTARNCKISYLRKNRRGLPAEQELEFTVTSGQDVAKEVELKPLSQAVMEKLCDLKPDTRAIFELRWKRNLTYKEIAEHVRIPENTIRSKPHRAKAWSWEEVASYW